MLSHIRAKSHLDGNFLDHRRRKHVECVAMSRSPDQNSSLAVGPHRIAFEYPDIVHIRYSGDVNLEQFIIMDDFIAAVPSPPPIFLLRDGREGGVASTEVRNYMRQKAHIEHLAAVVSYGTSFHAQTIVQMTNIAVKRLRKMGPEIAFCATEEEARALIDEYRRRMQADVQSDEIG